MDTMTFAKQFDFHILEENFRVLHVSMDWHGRPLLLVQEEGGQRTYRVISWTGGSPHTVTLEAAPESHYSHVQPLGSSWVLATGIDAGKVSIFDAEGTYQTSFKAGHGIQDIQTTSAGRIWVSYFDEGVFSDSIASEGLVCFERDGRTLFTYNTYARSRALPEISDCYSINSTSDSELWLSYYCDFPITCLEDFQVRRIWARGIPIYGGFRVKDGRIVNLNKVGDIVRWTPGSGSRDEILSPIDELGEKITGTSLRSVGRGERLILYNDRALYALL